MAIPGDVGMVLLLEHGGGGVGGGGVGGDDGSVSSCGGEDSDNGDDSSGDNGSGNDGSSNDSDSGGNDGGCGNSGGGVSDDSGSSNDKCGVESGCGGGDCGGGGEQQQRQRQQAATATAVAAAGGNSNSDSNSIAAIAFATTMPRKLRQLLWRQRPRLGMILKSISISSRLRMVLVEGSIHRLWPKNIEQKLRNSNASEMANGITASTVACWPRRTCTQALPCQPRRRLASNSTTTPLKKEILSASD
jgi:hypothetical protein